MESTKSVYTNNVLKSMTLENFKCFHQPVKIDFSQITMLYGPNSAGKSSILQAICYMAEILNGNLDVDITSHGGEEMDLGGFQNLLYNHNLNNTMKIGFELDVADMDMRPFKMFENDDNYNNLKNIKILFELKYSNLEHIPYVSAVKYTLNDKKQYALFSSEDMTKWTISLSSHSVDDLYLSSQEDIDIEDVDLDDLLALDGVSDDILERIKQYDASVQYIMSEGKNKLGALPRPIKDNYLHIFPVDTEDNIIISDEEGNYPSDYNQNHEYNKRWSNIVHLPLNILKNLVSQFRLIGPIRKIPARNFLPQKTKDIGRWMDGLAAWDAIQNMSDDEFSLLNKFLGEEYLNSGYQFREEIGNIKTAIRKEGSSDLFEKNIIKENEIDIKQWILWDEKNNIEVKPHDIGVGISQLLPFLIAMIYDIRRDGIINMVAIEQPELHIHPKMQVELGDVLINRAQMGMPLFIESHSEHILLRLLRRIRQTTNDEVPPERKQLYPENLSILYVNPPKDNNQSPQIYKLRVDKDGEFKDRWPEGFFAERGQELFG